MKRILFGVVALALLVSIAALIGAQLPAGHVARVTLTLPQSPDWVWAAITDFGATPQWFSQIKSSERIPDINGHPARREKFGGFTADMEVSEWDPPRKLTRVMHASQAGFAGSWTWELEAKGTGTQLTIIERGEVANPLLRLLGKLMDPTKSARQYGAALERRLAR